MKEFDCVSQLACALERNDKNCESKFDVRSVKTEKEKNPESVSRDMRSGHGGIAGECPCADKGIRDNIR